LEEGFGLKRKAKGAKTLEQAIMTVGTSLFTAEG